MFPAPLLRSRRDWRTRVLSVVILVAVAMSVAPAISRSEATTVDRFLVADREAIMALPTSGTAWQTVRDTAAKPLVPDLSDQNSMSASYAVAAGLVHVRTGDSAMRDKVVAALRVLPGTELRSPNILSVGRQMAGWIIAADLVGYRDPAFASWVSELRTKNIGGHGRWYAITRTHENSASWGTSSGMSRIAMSAYLGDTADVARAALLLRAYTGEDHEAWPGLPAKQNKGGFERTGAFDESWAGKLDHWVPINGYRNTKPELDGALIEFVSRSATSHPQAPDHTGLAYSWEGMAGLVMQAQLLSRQGYPDVWSWGDDALRRATDYLHRTEGFSAKNLTSPGRFVPWLIDAAYGTAYADRPAGHGRAFGYTDWLAPALTSNVTTTKPKEPTAAPEEPTAEPKEPTAEPKEPAAEPEPDAPVLVTETYTGKFTGKIKEHSFSVTVPEGRQHVALASDGKSEVTLEVYGPNQTLLASVATTSRTGFTSEFPAGTYRYVTSGSPGTSFGLSIATTSSASLQAHLVSAVSYDQ